jgi:hypothetical protein
MNMSTKLNLSQRLWLIDSIGSLASTTDLIKSADGFIGFLAPKEDELAVENLNFQVDENGLSWDTDVEAEHIKPLEVEIPEIIYSALKIKFTERLKDPTGLDLEMLSLLSL